MNSDVDYTDPQLTYYQPSWEMQYVTACKLFNYPDKEAPLGGQVQPEVSAGMPIVSKDGKTYTFTIRSGYRFSNGEPLYAATSRWRSTACRSRSSPRPRPLSART